MFLLLRQHVILPRTPDQSAVLFLVNTKTTQRNLLQSEKVLIKEKIAIESLRYLCAGLRKEDFLVTTSAAKFRSVWKDVVQHLGLQDFNYLPYSIRRGAATAAYNEGASLMSCLREDVGVTSQQRAFTSIKLCKSTPASTFRYRSYH